MGYCTSYSIDMRNFCEKGPSEMEAIAELTKINNGYFDNEYTFEECFYDSIKWYSHEEDMKELSNRFPNTLFILEGWGEELGDIWRKYFYRGRMKFAPAHISFEGPEDILPMTRKYDSENIIDRDSYENLARYE